MKFDPLALSEYKNIFQNHNEDAPRGQTLFEVTNMGLELVSKLEKIKHAVHNVEGSARDTVEHIKDLLP